MLSAGERGRQGRAEAAQGEEAVPSHHGREVPAALRGSPQKCLLQVGSQELGRARVPSPHPSAGQACVGLNESLKGQKGEKKLRITSTLQSDHPHIHS